jgi:hypothetical protein
MAKACKAESVAEAVDPAVEIVGEDALSAISLEIDFDQP